MTDDRTDPAAKAIAPAKARRAPGRHRARGLTRELVKKPALRRLLGDLLVRRPLRPAAERSDVVIACYPGLPYHRHMLWKAVLHAGMRLEPYRGDKGRTPAIGLFWADRVAMPDNRVGPTPPRSWWRGALNGRTGQDSKRTVEAVFASVFGYPLAIDPTTHCGPAVAKSDRDNGAHDGRVIDCPIAEADPGLAYEAVIDNRADEATVVDYRVPVIGGEIPFVYVKRRPLSDRFANANAEVALTEPDAVFSRDEQAGLAEVCRRLALDLGVELDVLRDRTDGRIYVVDANPNAWGPPRPIAAADAVRAVRLYASALVRLAERKSARAPEGVGGAVVDTP
ncbi:hypothetical protein [Marinivivus vitaminiproducens]|uniref:hypothetical protein n=1 Tax=Marinivivus vitaminiproducens TaxID=3035935 RepID=UPI00279B5E0A|nr:hypothetical protein P4R82_04970 [Geminicoccaceae bacterium SCSIO 64248]